MLNRKYLSKSGFSKKKKSTFKHLKNPTNQLNGTGQNFTILKTHMSVNQRILDVEKNPLSTGYFFKSYWKHNNFLSMLEAAYIQIFWE